MGSAKSYHADLMHRARILLAALCGHMGKPGGGFRTIGMLVSEAYLPLTHPLGLRHGKLKASPRALWWYIHGGLREVSGKKEYGDAAMKRSGVDDYVREALEKA